MCGDYTPQLVTVPESQVMAATLNKLLMYLGIGLLVSTSFLIALIELLNIPEEMDLQEIEVNEEPELLPILLPEGNVQRMAQPKYPRDSKVYVRRDGINCREPLWPGIVVVVIPTGGEFKYMVKLCGDLTSHLVTVPESQVMAATPQNLRVYLGIGLEVSTSFVIALLELLTMGEGLDMQAIEVNEEPELPSVPLPEGNVQRYSIIRKAARVILRIAYNAMVVYHTATGQIELQTFICSNGESSAFDWFCVSVLKHNSKEI
ncbi:hypothetical protein J6590_095026 [Homalodisca vitripennis]|nr:hypothetical protein J6590_095026 [Homalodisca vitripennis]